MTADMEEIVNTYQDFLKVAAACTSRLNVCLVSKAAQEAFLEPPATAKVFSERICGAFGYCKSKIHSSTSGVKLSPWVRSVGQSMRGSPTVQGSQQEVQQHGRSTARSSTVPPQGMSGSTSSLDPCLPVQITSEASVYAMYGMSPPKKKKPNTAVDQSEVAFICSSQEVCSSQDEELARVGNEAVMQPLASTEDGDIATEWLDPVGKVLVRILKSGLELKGKLEEGPEGFAVAKFASGDDVATEFPNLNLLPPPVLKKPAGAPPP